MERGLRDLEVADGRARGEVAQEGLRVGVAELLRLAKIAHQLDAGEAAEEFHTAVAAHADGVLAVAALDVGERAVEDFVAPVNHEDEVAHRLGHRHVVRAEDDGGAGGAEFEDSGADDLEVDGVEAGERLVEDEQLGPGDDGGDELDFLRHAFGERLDFLIGPLAQAHFRQPPLNLAGGVGAGHALERGVVGEHAADGHLLVEAALLGEVADAVVRGAGAALAEHFHRAGVGVEDVENGADGGGLAGAVGADEAVGATGGDGEREAADGGVRAEGLGDVGEPDRGGRRGGEDGRRHPIQRCSGTTSSPCLLM